MKMKAIDLIKNMRELNDDLVDAAKEISLEVDDDTLLAELARWAAKRCKKTGRMCFAR
jgi:ribonuclease J